MRRLLSALIFLCFAVVANSADAATTYVYTGSNYAGTMGSYSTSMKTTGSFTTASPLAANLTFAPIGPGGLNLVTQWSFNDGINTLTNLNSEPLGGWLSSFSVSTDASGHITEFQIEIMNPPSPNTVGQVMNSISVYSTSPYEFAKADAPCEYLTNGKCWGLSIRASTAFGGASGTFAVAASTTASTVSAPMLTPALLALLTLALLAFAYRARQDQV